MLRRETSDWHDRVEGAFGRFDLHDRRGVIAFLRAQARVVLPVERTLEEARVAELLPDWPSRRRGSALLADLAALRCRTPVPLAPCDVSTVGRCFGAIYVLEGSRLGGKVLARRASNGGHSFVSRFLSHDAGPGAWPGFLDTLDARACAPQDVLRGAIAVFEMFCAAAEEPDDPDAGLDAVA